MDVDGLVFIFNPELTWLASFRNVWSPRDNNVAFIFERRQDRVYVFSGTYYTIFTEEIGYHISQTNLYGNFAWI